MSTLPVNAVIVPDGMKALAIPASMVNGEWQFCAAVRFTEEPDGSVTLELATEADLEQITSPGAQS